MKAAQNDNWNEAMRVERRAERAGAAKFARACEQGDIREFYEAVQFLAHETVDGWRLAFQRVSRLGLVSPEIKNAFLGVWIQYKMLPMKIGDRRIAANGLKTLLVGGYSGPPLRVFRGTTFEERRYRLYGFSWTSQIDIARTFAKRWADEKRELKTRFPAPSSDVRLAAYQSSGAVILETIAPAKAILLVREDEGFYDEREVVLDPFQLELITVAERIR